MKCRVKKRGLITNRIIEDLLANQDIPRPYVFDKIEQSPFHTIQNSNIPSNVYGSGIGRGAGQSASSSNMDPESAHEPKGSIGRPRNHGVTTETRTYPFWWGSQNIIFIHAQLLNM